MKNNRWALVLGVLCLFTTSARADLRPEQDLAKDIAILSEKKVFEWRRIYAERDAAGLDHFLAENFVVLDPSGTSRTKQDEIDWLKETPRDNKLSDFIFTIKQIVFASNDTAIIYGHGDSTRKTADNKPCHHKYWSSNTFVRSKGQWKAAFSHVSGAKCTPLE